MRAFLIKIIATFFYCGYLPFIPGTFGSLAGVLVFYLIRQSGLNYALLTLALIILGIFTAGEAEKLLQKKDARCIVIDEVCGILLAFMFIPAEAKLVVIGFLLFRIFDAFKPYPAGCLEKLEGGLGVMSDDLVAGIYTNIILQVVLRNASFKAA